MNPQDLKHQLNGFPKGTTGYDREEKIIEFLYNAGQEIGYGRLEQLAEQMWKAIQNPDFIKALEKSRKERFETLNWKDEE